MKLTKPLTCGLSFMHNHHCYKTEQDSFLKYLNKLKNSYRHYPTKINAIKGCKAAIRSLTFILATDYLEKVSFKVGDTTLYRVMGLP